MGELETLGAGTLRPGCPASGMAVFSRNRRLPRIRLRPQESTNPYRTTKRNCEILLTLDSPWVLETSPCKQHEKMRSSHVYVRRDLGARSKLLGYVVILTAQCAKCFRPCLLRFRLSGRHEIRRPADLTSLVDRILPYVQRGVLTVVQDSGPFDELLRNPGSDGVYLIVFRCVKCAEEFQLLTAKGVIEMR
jgi:hypothetical protein